MIARQPSFQRHANFNAGQRAIVVTSHALTEPLGPLTVWDRGIASLIEELRGLADGDVWIVGGGKLQQAFIERGAFDQLELFVVPEIVGGGHPIFPVNGFQRSIKLNGAQALDAGVVRLDYSFE